jgi:hypothetical protein
MFDIIVFVVIVFILILSVYLLLYYKFDGNIKDKVEQMARLYNNDRMKTLLNGSGINNIPSLNIQTSNTSVNIANQCGHGAVQVGSQVDDSYCIRLCANSSATAFTVYEGEIVVSNSNQLIPGNYCMIGPRPECNNKTTIPMLTVNSVVCRSRFPSLFGGVLGNDIVACSSNEFSDANNILWDYLYDEQVDPSTILITDQDEQLTDGAFRFRCKFNGRDNRGNLYTESPFNRFIPWKNWCADNIYNAHDSVKTTFTQDDFKCDCGDYSVTRVKNMIEGNEKSQCAAYTYDRIDGDIVELSIPYKCFNMNSPITDIPKMMPCPPDKFSTVSSPLDQFKLKYTTDLTPLGIHPLYDPSESAFSIGILRPGDQGMQFI